MQNNFFENLDIENLPNAFLIEGENKEALSFVFDFLSFLKIPTQKNPDLHIFNIESFFVENVEHLLAEIKNKAFENKKVIILNINMINTESQNMLLKTFEDSSLDFIFFLIIPNKSVLLPTVISRFYFLGTLNDKKDYQVIKDFIKMPFQKRIEFIADMIKKHEDSEKEDSLLKREVLYFLNNLESFLEENQFFINKKNTHIYKQIIQTRKLLSFQAAPIKMLLESLALQLPFVL